MVVEGDVDLHWISDLTWEGNTVAFAVDPKKNIRKAEVYGLNHHRQAEPKDLEDYTACEESFEVVVQIYLSKTQKAEDVKVIWEHREHYTAKFAPGKRTDPILGIDEPQHPQQFGDQWGSLSLLGMVPDKEFKKISQRDRWGQLKYPYRGVCVNVCSLNQLISGTVCDDCWDKVKFDVLPPNN